MTSLVFVNFYFDHNSYTFGLGFRLGFKGLGLELGLRLGLMVSFFRHYYIYKMSTHTERALSLLVLNKTGFLHQTFGVVFWS